MKLKGKVHKFGDNINTDEIIPARYLNTSDPAELAKHCMEDADPKFVPGLKEGDVIVAGENFGCGSSREHAPIAVKASGVSCVIAKSFARIFYRNAINIGLPIFTSAEASEALKSGESVQVDVTKGEISRFGRKRSYSAEVFPGFIRDIIRSGGLMEFARKRQKEEPVDKPRKKEKKKQKVRIQKKRKK
ncbi:MAG: 3-isopropylmalate dehydratase small subunit [Candidatus Omnitrophota bacterium]|nr:3-isopropylmalate dehydratase small subunit [Candidatus Omnitrophota bacterium]